ncbi:hypothetical protein EMIT0194MI4_10893 [Pseudomonas sp. IT-194MI4]
MGQLTMTVKVQRHAFDPLFFRSINVHRTAAARVVDQDVDVTHSGQSSTCNSFWAVSRDKILNERDRCYTTRIGDFAYQTDQQLFVSRSSKYLHTFSGQAFDNGSSEPLASTGYQSSFSSKLHIHGESSNRQIEKYSGTN